MRRTLMLLLAVPTALALAALLPSPEDGSRIPGGPDATIASNAIDRSPPTAESDAARPRPPAAEAEGPTGPLAAVADSDATETPSAPPASGPTTGVRDAPEDLTAEGFLIAPVPETGAITGSGPRWRYTIEVEPATGFDVAEVASFVRASLGDDRSWARTRSLEQVDDPHAARIRMLVATPETVDALCARAGLRTVGIFSCWNGRFAALNGWRWAVGATGFSDLDTYRTYLVNHEFGHGLGYGHVGCPASGSAAPVMMQQSKGLDGCVANGWPFP